VRLRDVPDEREAQAAAWDTSLQGIAAAKERLEDAFPVGNRQPRTVVVHAHDSLAPIHDNVHFDVVTELQGVRKSVDDHRAEQNGISAHEGIIFFSLDTAALRRG
jgi:hypothetical protein